jgi:putative nucleotidyltransferase with HDIG domain
MLMLSEKLSPTRLFRAFEALMLVAAVALAATLSRSADWHPILLVALLLGLTLVGEFLATSTGNGVLSTAHVALVLAMSLLGPAPAVLFGLAVMTMTSAQRRVPLVHWLNNLSNYAAYPLVGALIVRALAGNVHAAHNHLTHNPAFGLIVLGVFMLTLAVNFLIVALETLVDEGRSLVRQVREAFLPVLPGHLATGVLAGLLAVAYANLGLTVLFAAVLVLVIFQYLTIALLRSEDRADQLEARSIQLASMQFGVLATLMDALALRNRSTARHSAAVARYAKRLAVELGCSEDEQETIHTAALLHDIGKFTLPDRILHSDLLSDEDWAMVRRHPQDGAALVGKLDGYGAVAEAILYHHEQVDGGGYPAGLIGREIPQASRMIAICSTFDTLTSRDSYRSSMTPQDAMAELRKVAGRQLDGELVEKFIAMLEKDGKALLLEEERPDFAAELAFEQRVRRMALPAAK